MPVALTDLNGLLTKRGLRHGLGDFQGDWVHRHPFNVPGPFYVACDLAAGEGPVAAPLNVYQLEGAAAELSGEFVFKQPSTIDELDAVLVAAAHNCVSEYGLDGDSHWTRKTVVAWWHWISAEQRTLRLGSPSAAGARWLSFLRDDAERYLRCYVVFLETGRYPTRRAPLPEL